MAGAQPSPRRGQPPHFLLSRLPSFSYLVFPVCLSFGPCHLSFSQVCPNVPPQSLTPVGQATRDALFLCTPGSSISPLSLAPRPPSPFQSPSVGPADRFPRLSGRKGVAVPGARFRLRTPKWGAGPPHLGREGVSSLLEREPVPLGQAPSPPHSQKPPSPLLTGAPAGWCDKPTLPARPQVLVGDVADERGESPARHPPRYSTRRRPAAAAATRSRRRRTRLACSHCPRRGPRPTARPAQPNSKAGKCSRPRDGWEARAGGVRPAPPPRLTRNGFGPRHANAGWTPATTTALLIEGVGGSEKSL